jgi:hypothetical protein
MQSLEPIQKYIKYSYSATSYKIKSVRRITKIDFQIGSIKKFDLTISNFLIFIPVPLVFDPSERTAGKHTNFAVYK